MNVLWLIPNSIVDKQIEHLDNDLWQLIQSLDKQSIFSDSDFWFKMLAGY